jgi:glycosyltransferase involved in cell wall biosynthesis
MKIAYICSDIDVQLYGHEGCSVHVRELTNALVDAGHDVFIICAWAGDRGRLRTRARVYNLEPDGVDATVWSSLEQEPLIQDHHLERDLRSVLWNYWLLTRGAEIMEREQPDFLYERYALFGWGGLQLAQRYGLPLVLELNAPLCDQQEGYEKFTLTSTAAKLERRILSQAGAIIALTAWLKDWAISRGSDPERIHIVPDAVSERLFAEQPTGESVRRRHGLKGKRVVGFVGSFHWWHDVEALLAAFDALHGTDPELRLLLVGDGETRKKLTRQVQRRGLEDRVIFTGKIPHEEVPQHFAAMDVVVVPYVDLKDFFFSPMKLFEGMAAGRPTVATALGQIQEVIEHGETGWLYPAGDVEKLGQGIGLLLGDEGLARRTAEAGRRRVLENYTWKRVAERVVEIAGGLLKQRHLVKETQA